MPASLYIVRPTLGTGGADRVTLNLLRHLPVDRFRPTLVLMQRRGELLSEVPVDVPIHVLGARSLWTAWLSLARLVRRDRPDILFSTSSGTNIIAVLAHLLAGRPGRLVLSERGGLRTKLSWKKKVQRWLKKVLYPHADRITTVSEGVRDELVARLRLPPESISVVLNPIVDARMEALTAEPVLHPWFANHREAKPPVILTAGRMVVEKDHATLLRAFARIAQEREVRLMILGEGALRGELEALADRLGIRDRVAFPGFDPNPFKYMARCSLFALSSRFEGLPGVLIQAMACGAPVVSTDCPSGPSEIIQNGKNGILVPVGDSQALSRAFSALLTNDEWRRDLGERGRRSVQRFHVDRILPKYETALLGGAT